MASVPQQYAGWHSEWKEKGKALRKEGAGKKRGEGNWGFHAQRLFVVNWKCGTGTEAVKG